MAASKVSHQVIYMWTMTYFYHAIIPKSNSHVPTHSDFCTPSYLFPKEKGKERPVRF